MYAHVCTKLVHCIPLTYIMLYVNYIAVSRHISISLSIYGSLWEAPLQQNNFVPFVQGSVMQRVILK